MPHSTEAPIVIHQHFPPAPLLIVTEKNAERAGLTPKALRKLAREGLPHTRTMDGVTVLVAELDAYLRATSHINERRIEPELTDGEQLEDLALARAGLTLNRVGLKEDPETARIGDEAAARDKRSREEIDREIQVALSRRRGPKAPKARKR